MKKICNFQVLAIVNANGTKQRHFTVLLLMALGSWLPLLQNKGMACPPLVQREARLLLCVGLLPFEVLQVSI